MQPEVQIEAVGDAERSEALRFLVGGQRRDVSVAVRAEAFERMIERCGGKFWLRRARRGARHVAAALAVASPGRVGMVFYSPLAGPGTEPQCVAPLVREASRSALNSGLAFVQSLVVPGRDGATAMLASAGFERLAELIYMRMAISSARAEGGGRRYTWRSYRKFRQAELESVILGTYEDSLDCPRLCGLRSLSDVIAGHKASGVFSPRSWWIVEHAGRPAGCILVNGSTADAQTMEVAYMGVVRAFRGRGVGRTMLRRAARWARRRRRRVLTVAVDSENVYAKRVYVQEGFLETDRRVAWILAAGRRGAAPA